MRAAPAARALSCGPGAWLRVQQALVALSAAVAAYWAGAQFERAGPALLALCIVLGLAAGAGVRRRLAEPPARLAWDGAAWSLQEAAAEPCAGRPLLMLDLGGWMLVHFVRQAPRRGSRWLAFSRAASDADWRALRIALLDVRASAPRAGARA